MKYIDRIYGEFEIDEPVILELMASPSMQRLRGVDQYGHFEPFRPGVALSRFEHSVGVYLLLRRYGASLAEQVAGLIHDVSHSAFSHCIDYVFDGSTEATQSHQDNVFDEYVRRSELPGILQMHGLDVGYILDDTNFPLKENGIPDLCADRIDYGLRGMLEFGVINDVSHLIDDLTATNGQWVFADFASAERFAELFRRLNDHFMALDTPMKLRTVGDYLRHSLNHGYITEADLYTTDDEVLQKVEPHLSHDAGLHLLWERMNNRVGYRNNSDNYDARVVCKSRIVDPLCWYNGVIQRVSQVDPRWVPILEEGLQPREYFLKFDK